MDREGMRLIESHDSAGFRKYLKETQNTICGRHPISLLLNVISKSQLNLRTEFVRYDQSEHVKDSRGSSVSYASGVTYEV
jgi:AmmeMemoRadiSam system protein B